VINYGLEYSRKPVGEGPAKAGLEQPVYYWDPVISPSSLAFYRATCSRSGRATPSSPRSARPTWCGWCSTATGWLARNALLADRKERLRLVRQAPDGALYVLTDGPQGKLLRLTPTRS
jgi:glucose/arabinose dehydrogenase